MRSRVSRSVVAALAGAVLPYVVIGSGGGWTESFRLIFPVAGIAAGVVAGLVIARRECGDRTAPRRRFPPALGAFVAALAFPFVLFALLIAVGVATGGLGG